MILITGGAGFVGSHVADALVAEGHRVRILDSLAVHAGLPAYLPAEADFLQGDVRDRVTVARALAGVTHVSHQAGMVGLGKDFLDVADYVMNNDAGTAVLLRELASRGFSGRFVLASSMVVYGEGRYLCAEHGLVRPGPRRLEDLELGRFEPRCPRCGKALEARAVPEDAELDPRNVYAATKVHQEHLARCFERETRAPVTMLRYHNVYGPRMPRDTPYAGVASLFASALAAGQPARVFEDGAQRRDFVHVRDVALANVLALTVSKPVTGAINVASGQPRIVAELASALTDSFGAGAPRPQITGEYRRGDVRHVFASTARAARDLGFEAREDFGQGVRELALALSA
jgi:dTDP-L-rhamnose 4-epimerase